MMINPEQPISITAHDDQALNTLERAIRLSQGQFSLILVRCNYGTLRDQILSELQKRCPFQIHILQLSKSAKTLYSAIKAEVQNTQLSALIVLGLETVSDLDTVLTSTNQVREEFRKDFSFPIVLWINDTVLQKLIKLAPDFESWSTSIEFCLGVNELILLIRNTTNDSFKKIAEIGTGRLINSALLHPEKAFLPYQELKFALQDLRGQAVRLELELEASAEFVLGQNVYHLREALHHYEQSLNLWHQRDSIVERQEVNRDLDEAIDSSARYGVVLFYTGAWWRRYAILNRIENESACRRARDYFQQAIAQFHQHHAYDLEAKFISALGEVLQKLQLWQDLEEVVKRSLVLHEAEISIQEEQSKLSITEQGDCLVRLAYDYGLMANVALSKTNWVDAKNYAEKALKTLREAQQFIEVTNLPDKSSENYVWSYHQAFHRRSLSQALASLNQEQEAIQILELARSEGSPKYDPTLYLQILYLLRDLYFKQHDYLKAFRVRQTYRSIEQQYGFRAFVGAGRLQSQKTIMSSDSALVAEQSNIAQEISASGRQQDVNRLIARMERTDCKLTVIYGQSGVGKSSILQAGFIPAVSPQLIEARNVVVILQQVYTNWTSELGDRMIESLTRVNKDANRKLALNPLDSPSSILKQIHQGVEQNLLTIVVFDQFEEFFFIYKDPAQRKPFYDFLYQCLNIPYVKVILSLREDYLHFLLECNRLENLEVINNNILDKNILFYLGNFSKQDAGAVIQSLATRAQFLLDDDLLETLVQDLAKDLGEIRPIELQIVGAQLQTEQITSLVQYQEKGPKEALVGRYLEEVVKDCGTENEQIAKLVLYLLTDENNTRPLKTRSDLELELDVVAEKLDLVLTILVESRLVFQIPSSPSDRYQLVHDYLVAFVRQQQSARLIAELEKEREQRKLTEAKLNQVLKQQLQAARRATLTLTGLVVAIGGVAAIAALVAVNSFIWGIISSASQNEQLDRVVTALRAGRALQQWRVAIPEIRRVTLAGINQAIATTTEVNRLEGHTGEITEISFSADGNLFASASRDNTIKVWRMNGQLLKSLTGHNASVTSVSFSPDGSKIVSASEDGTVRLWNLMREEPPEILAQDQGIINVVRFSPDGKSIAWAGANKTITIWRNNSRSVLTGHQVAVTELSFSPDNNKLSSAGEFDVVRLWNLDTLQQIGYIDVQEALEVRFDDIETISLVDKGDETLKLYNLKGDLLTGSDLDTFGLKQVRRTHNSQSIASSSRREQKLIVLQISELTYYLEHQDVVNDFSISSDGKWLVVATSDNKLVIHDLLNYQDQSQPFVFSFSRHTQAAILSGNNNKLLLLKRDQSVPTSILGDTSVSSFSPDDSDNQSIITASTNTILNIWNSSGVRTVPEAPNTRMTTVALSPDGQTMITGGEDGSIQLRDRNGNSVRAIEGHNQAVESITISPDGTLFVSTSIDKTILWRIDGTPLQSLASGKEVSQVIFSPDSQAIVSIEKNGLAKLWKRNGVLLATLSGHPTGIWGVVFSPNSQVVATYGSSRSEEPTIKLWSLNGTVISEIVESHFARPIFHPENNTIAVVSSQGFIRLFDLNGNPLTNSKRLHSSQIRDVTFSSDGEIIATVGEDRTVKIWNGREDSIPIVLGRHEAEVTGVAFSPDGKTLASVDRYSRIKLWSVEERNVVRDLQGRSIIDVDDSQFAHNQVRFSPDGKSIIFSSYVSAGRYESNYEITTWDMTGNELRNLTGYAQQYGNFAISSDGNVAALLSQEPVFKRFSLDGTVLATFAGHTDRINSVTFSPDGRFIASASDDGTVRLWHPDGRLIKTFEEHEDRVNSVSFSFDSQTLASGGDDRTVRLWNISGVTSINSRARTDRVTSVLFHPTQNILASAVPDGTITLWNRDTQAEREVRIDSRSELDALSFSLDGSIVALGTQRVAFQFLDAWFLMNTTYAFKPINFFPPADFASRGDIITVTGNRGTMVLTLGLNHLLAEGCTLANNYLQTNNNLEQREKALCNGVVPEP